MFLFTKSAKERVVTGGTVLALLLLLALSLRTAWVGGYDLILSLFCILIAAAIFKGLRLGYAAGMFIFGGLAALLPLGVINPFCYDDTTAAHVPYAPLVYDALLTAALFAFLFYSLGKHGRLRNPEQESRFSLPRGCTLSFGIGYLLILFCGMAPNLSMMSIGNPPSTKNLGHAKQLAMACSLYAKDNDGKYPTKLHDLVPVYIKEADYSETLFHDFSGSNVNGTTRFFGFKTSDTTHEYDSRPAQEWAYYGAQPVKPGQILIASPAPSTIPRGPVRVVIYAGEEMHGAVINEAEYQSEMQAQRQQ